MTGGVVMAQWVIYQDPKDHSGGYVARRWDIHRGGVVLPADNAWFCDDLDGARMVVLANLPDGYRMDRQPDDDPTIVEVWT